MALCKICGKLLPPRTRRYICNDLSCFEMFKKQQKLLGKKIPKTYKDMQLLTEEEESYYLSVLKKQLSNEEFLEVKKKYLSAKKIYSEAWVSHIYWK